MSVACREKRMLLPVRHRLRGSVGLNKVSAHREKEGNVLQLLNFSSNYSFG